MQRYRRDIAFEQLVPHAELQKKVPQSNPVASLATLTAVSCVFSISFSLYRSVPTCNACQ